MNGWLLAIEGVVALATIVHAIIYATKFARWLKSRRSDGRTITRSKKDYLIGVGYSVLCALLWSLGYVTLSYVSSKADALEINVIVIGSAFFFFLLGWRITRFWKNDGANTEINWDRSIEWSWVVVLSNLASFLLFIYALYYISASQTITLQKINPLFIALVAWMLRKEKLSRSALSAVAVAVIGTILILANDQFGFEGGNNVTGSLLAIFAGLSFAFFAVGLEEAGEHQASLTHRLRFMTVIFFLSYAGIVTVGYLQGRPLTAHGWVLIIVLGNGLRVAVVYGFYYAAVRRIGALLVSVIVALEVPFTIFWDWSLLHRIAGPRLVLGAVAILLGGI